MTATASGPGDPNNEQRPPDEPSTELVKREEIRPAEVTETSSVAVAAREKAAVEARYLKAMHNPRDFDTARQRLLTMCQRPRFAEKVEYAKPVGGSKVRGLSIRFAEAAMMVWGNIDIRQVIVFDDRQRRTYRVAGTDLETNATVEQDVIVEKFVERRKTKAGDEIIGSRTNSQGQTVYIKAATEDEVLIKANSLIAKARRNIILQLLPPDLKEEAIEFALDTVRDRDAKDPDTARKQILDGFWRVGVTAAQVKELVGKSLDQLNPAELGMLRTIWRALDDGEASWDDIVADAGLAKWRDTNGEKAKPAETRGTAGLKEQVKQKAEKGRTDPKATEQPELDEPSEAEIRKQDAEIVEEEAAASQAKGREK